MDSFYGTIDFTKLCRIWKEHRELFRSVQFNDGEHFILNMDFKERFRPDNFGHTHMLYVPCKQEQRRPNLDYYIGSRFKRSQFTDESKFSKTSTPQDSREPSVTQTGKDSDEFPF